MKIAIIGAGRIGSSLARGLTQCGHAVHVGTRRAGQPDEHLMALQKDIGPAGRIESGRKAAIEAGVIVLALPWRSAHDAIHDLGPVSGKVVIDCMNPFRADRSGLEIGLSRSLAEDVQAWLPGNHVVKTFNHIAFEHLEHADFGGIQPSMFFCGDDADAKKTVSNLIGQLGFEPVDAGSLAMARLLEPLGLLFSRLAREEGNGRNIAFKLLRRNVQDIAAIS